MFSYYSQLIAKYSGKLIPFIQAYSFPLPKTAEKAFEYLKAEIENVILYSIDETVLFTVETNASYHSIEASLNQSSRPVAFFSSTTEWKPSSLKKETQAVVAVLHKWRHYLTECHFTLLIDHRSVAFMFDSK